MYKPRLPDAPREYNAQWASDLIRVLQHFIDSIPNMPANKAEYTPSNVTLDRSYDADATTTAELADVLGTLIADLKDVGILHGKAL